MEIKVEADGEVGHSVLCRGARDSLSLCLLQFWGKVTGNGFESEHVQEYQNAHEYLRVVSLEVIRSNEEEQKISAQRPFSFATARLRKTAAGLPPLAAACIRVADSKKFAPSLHTQRFRLGGGWRCDRKFRQQMQDREKCKEWTFPWS